MGVLVMFLFHMGWLAAERGSGQLRKGRGLDVRREKAEMVQDPRVLAAAKGTKNGRRRIVRWTMVAEDVKD
jgi:hypothetical protein